jgi:hypothetical protein
LLGPHFSLNSRRLHKVEFILLIPMEGWKKLLSHDCISDSLLMSAISKQINMICFVKIAEDESPRVKPT